MEFNDQINYIEFWENRFEELDYPVELRTPSPEVFVKSEFTEIVGDRISDIRETSPDIFADFPLSEQEVLDSTPCSNTKEATILNHINKNVKRERDEVKIFIMNSIRTLFMTSSSCTSRELFYKCPRNITSAAFYQKVSWINPILYFL